MIVSRQCFIVLFLFFKSPQEEAVINKPRSKKVKRKYETRKKLAKVEAALEEQFSSGRVLGEYNSITL